MNEEKVILVNEKDEQIGLMPKLEAHEKAILHRAFSVFIFNDKNASVTAVLIIYRHYPPSRVKTRGKVVFYICGAGGPSPGS